MGSPSAKAETNKTSAEGKDAHDKASEAAPAKGAQAKKPRAVRQGGKWTRRAAAAPRPNGGWDHKGGRDPAEIVVGEVAEGIVTNVLYKRVWVNIGAARDASFMNESENVSYKVGDRVSGLPVKAIDLNNGHVQLQAP